jgi:hypothetical protein
MRCRSIGALALLLAAGCVWDAPDSVPSVPVDYPIRHYAFTEDTEDTADLETWKAEVREFRDELRIRYRTDVTGPRLLSDSKEAEFLDRAVDPARLVWRDPRYFFKTPVLLSWWEVIDERGHVQRVYVVASNQTREADARILAWCVNDKLWKPGELEGNPTTTIRSASINLGESKYHLHYWQKFAGPKSLVAFTLAAIALPVWLVARGARRRRERRARHEALMKHVAHKPFHAPSIDEPPKL